MDALLQVPVPALLQVPVPALVGDEVLAAIGVVFDARDRLWSFLCTSSVFSIEGTLIHWQWLQKAVSTLTACALPIALPAALQASFHSVSSALLATTPSKSLLWKLGGHPAPMTSEQAAGLFTRLCELEMQLDVVDPETHGLSARHVLDEEFKRMFAEAVATLSWINDVGPERGRAMLEAISSAPDSLSNRMHMSQRDLKSRGVTNAMVLQLIGEDADEEDVEVHKATMVALDDELIVLRLAEQLWPMYDGQSLQFDLQLLMELASVVALPARADLSRLKAALLRAYQYYIRNGVRSPVDFAPHVKLLWLFDQQISDTAKFAPILSELLYRWNTRLWNEQASNGAQRLVGDSARAFQLIAVKNTQLREAVAKQSQLRTFGGMLMQRTSSFITAQSLSLLRLLTAHTLMCFVGTLPEATQAVSADLLAALAQQPLSSQETASLLQVLAQSTNVTFCSLVPSVIASCLQTMQTAAQSGATRGKGWALLGLLRLSLLRPEQPVDPVAKCIAKLAHLQSQIDKVQTEVTIRLEAEALFTGRGTDANIRRLKEQLKMARHAVELVRGKVAFRPAPSQFADIFHDIHEFTASYLDPAKLALLLERLEAAQTSAITEEGLLQQNVQQFIDRLSRRYPLYADVLQPLSVACYQLKYGLRVLTAAASRPSHVARLNTLAGDLLRCPMPILPEHINKLLGVNVLSALRIAQGKSAPAVQVSILRVALHRLCIYASNTNMANEPLLNTLHAVFMAFVEAWRIHKDEEDRRRAEEAETFRYKAKSHVFGSEEAKEFRAMRMMFPDFSGDYVDIVGMEESKAADAERDMERAVAEEIAAKQARTPLPLSKDEVISLCEMHRRAYTHLYSLLAQQSAVTARDTAPASELLELMNSSYATAQRVTTNIEDSLNDLVDDASISAHAVQTGVSIQKLDSPSVVEEDASASLSPAYNLYQDPNVREAVLVLVPIRALMQRLKQLLDQWPENATLQQLLKICDRILSFPSSSSLIKVLTGLELLLTKGQQWEDVASVAVSLEENLKPIKALVKRWRRLELDSWPFVLRTQQRDAETKASQSWFRLYALLNASAVDDGAGEQFLSTLFQTLEEFIQTSTIGQLRTRMELLETFYKQAMIEQRYRVAKFSSAVGDRVANILHNYVQFYKQFLPQLDETLKMALAPIEQQLQEHTKLQRWDDYNYYALKTSVHKSQSALTKFARQYREVLRRPFPTLIYQVNANLLQFSRIGVDAAPAESAAVQVIVPDPMQTDELFLGELPAQLQQLLGIAAPKSRVAKLNKLTLRMASHCNKGLVSELINDTPLQLETLTGDMLSRVESLQSEKSHPVKQRAFTDLLHLLRDLGFNWRAAARTEDQQNLQYLFERPSANLDIFLQQWHTGPDVTSSWDRADHYYFCNLLRMQKLRLSTDLHKDLTSAQGRLISGYAEHLLFVVMQQRASIVNVVEEFETSVRMSASLASASTGVQLRRIPKGHCVLPVQKHLRQILVNIRDSCELFAQTVSQLAVMHDTIVNGTAQLRFLPTELDARLPQLAQSARTAAGTAETLLFMPLLLSEHRQWCDSTVVTVRRMVAECLAALVEFAERPVLKCTVDDLRRADTLLCVSEAPSVVAGSSVDTAAFVADFGTRLDRLVTSSLLGVQRITQCVVQVTDDEQTPVFKVHNALVALTKELGLAAFNEQFRSLIGDLISVRDSCTPKDFDAVNACTALLLRYRALLRQYCIAVQQALTTVIALHKSTCKFHYVLLNLFISLVTVGFCRPPEEQESKEGDQVDHKEGTGMGDGQGDKDVSNEIENEDQLTGSGRDKEKPQKPEDKAEKDQGVEMTNDFEGEMEDFKPSDNEESGSEDEREELDRKMGDLGDEADADVVDEQMWDSDEENDPTTQDEEKFEKNAPMKGGEKLDEMHTREDDNMHEDRPPEADKDEASEAPQTQPDLDNLGGDDEAQDEKVNEEKFEDHHGPEADQTNEFELPDQPQDDAAAGAEEDDDEDKAGDEADENMQDGTNKDGGPDALQEEQQDEVEPLAEPDAQDTDMPDIGQEPPGDDNKEPSDTEADTNAEETVADPSRNQESSDEGEYERPGDLTESKPAAPEAVGIEEGKSNAQAAVDEMEQGGQENQPDENLNTAADDVQQASADSQWRTGMDAQPSAQTTKQTQQSNPYRSAGDAMKQWKRRLNIVDSAQEQAQAQQERKEASDAQTFAFMAEDDPMQEDAQALGAADEQQQQPMTQQLPESPPAPASPAQEDEEQPPQPENPLADTQRPVNTQRTGDNRAAATIAQRNDTAKEQDEDEQRKLQEQDAKMRDDGDDDIINAPAEAAQLHDNQVALTGMSPEDVQQLREELEHYISQWRATGANLEHGQEVYRRLEAVTHDLSQELCEQLRLVLEPTLASKLRGDYRTGKRINMKKVIPYIASNFKKDQIWLRRTKPNKRQYQVMIAIDDSASMAHNNAGNMALEALVLIAKAMASLEVGEVGIASFGAALRLLHPFKQPFTDDAGAHIVPQFTFQQQTTDMARFVESAVQMLEIARQDAPAHQDYLQLVFVVSDGMLTSRDQIARWSREAHARHQLLVFIIIDNPARRDSILEQQVVQFVQGKVVRTAYLDDFPFPYYIVLRDVARLPEVLADALRQWFESIERA
eukprot:TRINITY_DN2908_c0_g3_i1.p1 TRINITY_DN2908_c0_g3~~TRINITY_DN2908_c0_g3_i1.p1  ORF type:complete len:2883 (+),score=867.28 TRINITY_DN2908_c0_g3_i1:749-8650(+)